MISYLILLKLRKIKELEKNETSTSRRSVQSLCRMCLGSQELRPLFPLKSKYRSLERAFFLCTGLQIAPDDGLPQTICRPCSQFFESAIQFRKKSRASEVTLIERYKYKKKTCNSIGVKDSEKIMRNIEVQSKSNEDQVVLDINYEWYGNEQSIDEFYSEPENAKENEEVRRKKKKPKQYIKDNNYLNMMENSGDSENPIRCKQCKKSMKTLLGFKVHVKRHTLTCRILCEYCGMSYNSKASLARHLQSRHGMARDDRYPCSYCDFRALDLEMLQVHERRIHTKERPFVCHDCGEAFFSKRVLRQHMDVHTPDRPFQCHVCLHNYKSKGRLAGHIMKIHRPRKYSYKCSYCPKTYLSTYNTRKHMAKGHGIPNNQQGKLERIKNI